MSFIDDNDKKHCRLNIERLFLDLDEFCDPKLELCEDFDIRLKRFAKRLIDHAEAYDMICDNDDYYRDALLALIPRLTWLKRYFKELENPPENK